MKKLFLVICIVCVTTFAQHQLPFASKDNSIELLLSNSSLQTTTNVVVSVSNPPAWLKFAESEKKFPELRLKSSATALFTFSVDKSAPVNKPTDIIFKVSNGEGETWSKTLTLQISPPEKFEVFQNYPNPFNPSTTISYLLPLASTVSVKVYDMLGREVITLVNDQLEEPGYHQWIWNASGAASGVYIYQVYVKTTADKKDVVRKKMLLVK